MSAGARAALYTAEGSTLMTCARHAERAGLRVVTMIEEEPNSVVSGLGGAQLHALVDRLGDGEFEVIVADAGSGRIVTIAAPVPAARCAREAGTGRGQGAHICAVTIGAPLQVRRREVAR